MLRPIRGDDELAYADVKIVGVRLDGVPWLRLTTPRGQFWIQVKLLPAEWTGQRIAALITARSA